MLDKQNQQVGEGATAIQAGQTAIVVQGITFEAARQIALDVYQANFPVLVAQAAELARARAVELTDKFLKELHVQHPAGLAQATTPGFQNALLQAQREHACAGDSDLADLLVDLLVDRTKQQARSLQQLVIDEALRTAPKLTEDQLAVLGTVFVIGYARSTAGRWDEVVRWFREHVEPVLAHAKVTPSTLPHLQFTGCANARELGGGDIASGLLDTYSCFFQNGLTLDQVNEKALTAAALKYVAPMPNAPELRQVMIVNARIIDDFQKKGEYGVDDAQKLKQLLAANRKSLEEFRHQVLAEMPFLQRAFELWTTEDLGRLIPTSVGLAIGHAYVKKATGREFAPLTIWIQ